MGKERIHYWDNLKGLLIFLVVIGHILIRYDNNLAENLRVVIYAFHMPLFAYVLGIFAEKSYNKSPDRVTKTIVRMFLLYLFIETIYYYFTIYILEVDLLKSYVYPYYTYWWLIFIIQVNLMIPLFKYFKPYVFMIVSFIALLYAGTDPKIGTYLSFGRLIYFLPFFLLGFYFNEKKVLKFVKQWKYVLYVVGLVAAVILAKLPGITSTYFGGTESYKALKQTTLEGMTWRVEGYLFTIIISLCVMAFIPMKKLVVASFLGRNSLTIYLTHGMVLKYLKKRMKDVHFSGSEFEVMIKDGCIRLAVVIIACAIVYALQKLFSYLKEKYKQRALETNR